MAAESNSAAQNGVDSTLSIDLLLLLAAPVAPGGGRRLKGCGDSVQA